MSSHTYTTTGPPSTQADDALPLLLTVDDVASQLRCSLSYAHRLVARDQIRSVKLGKARRVRASDLGDFVDGLLDGATKA